MGYLWFLFMSLEELPCILYIDDSRADIEYIKKMLDGKAKVVGAKTSKAGIKKSKERDFRIVVVDVNLGTENGFEVCMLLRDNLPDATYIVTSGLFSDVWRIRGRNMIYSDKQELYQTLVDILEEQRNVRRING